MIRYKLPFVGRYWFTVPVAAALLLLFSQGHMVNGQELRPGTRTDDTAEAGNDAAEQIPLPENVLDRPISELTINVEPTGQPTSQPAAGDEFKIKDRAAEYFQSLEASRGLGHGTPSPYVHPFCWAAPGFCHQPLYFEQINVERYGHHVRCGACSDCAQSVVCAAHFFTSVPLLPYKMGADPCCERQYTLGHYRPGSCNPHQWHFVRPTDDGLACEAIVITGLIFLIP